MVGDEVVQKWMMPATHIGGLAGAIDCSAVSRVRGRLKALAQ
jgi:hypothetical protein